MKNFTKQSFKFLAILVSASALLSETKSFQDWDPRDSSSTTRRVITLDDSSDGSSWDDSTTLGVTAQWAPQSEGTTPQHIPITNPEAIRTHGWPPEHAPTTSDYQTIIGYQTLNLYTQPGELIHHTSQSESPEAIGNRQIVEQNKAERLAREEEQRRLKQEEIANRQIVEQNKAERLAREEEQRRLEQEAIANRRIVEQRKAERLTREEAERAVASRAHGGPYSPHYPSSAGYPASSSPSGLPVLTGFNPHYQHTQQQPFEESAPQYPVGYGIQGYNPAYPPSGAYPASSSPSSMRTASPYVGTAAPSGYPPSGYPQGQPYDAAAPAPTTDSRSTMTGTRGASDSRYGYHQQSHSRRG